MKNLFLLSIIILLTSFKEYQADATLNIDYEVKYKIENKEISVFVSKSNSKDLLISNLGNSHKNDNQLFTFLQDTKSFKLRISDSNEVDWSRSEYRVDLANENFNEIVETKETKIINNILCNRYIGKSSIFRSRTNEVYISKNNKINNVNFLLSLGIKCNPTIKGLVMEMNSIKDKTSETEYVLSLNEIKPTKKAIKLADANLKKLIEKEEYNKKHENDVTVSIEGPRVEESPKPVDTQMLKKQLATGHLKLNQIGAFPFDKIYEINKDMVSLTIENSPELSNIPESVKNFKSLSEISIYGTRLTEFPMGFCYTNSLNTFVYGGNLTPTIPKEIGNLKNLKNLTLYSLPLKEIPKEIGNLENLQLLIIFDTKGDNTAAGPFRTGGMQYIPKEIGNLKMLQNLELENNNLMEIHKEIGSLNKLTVLSLSDNNLKSLPKEIYNLQNLEILNLSNNPLESISEDISKLKKLELLNLHNTKLKSIPKAIYNMQNLESLILSNNSLESISEEITNLKKLKKLDLSENKIPKNKILELMHKMPNTHISF
ncbi:MAG TPA: leucine-rich repeat domain-containing protein [Flavobacterium sp.]